MTSASVFDQNFAKVVSSKSLLAIFALCPVLFNNLGATCNELPTSSEAVRLWQGPSADLVCHRTIWLENIAVQVRIYEDPSFNRLLCPHCPLFLFLRFAIRAGRGFRSGWFDGGELGGRGDFGCSKFKSMITDDIISGSGEASDTMRKTTEHIMARDTHFEEKLVSRCPAPDIPKIHLRQDKGSLGSQYSSSELTTMASNL